MTATKPATVNRFSLPFGVLFSQTLSIYFRNFVPFTLLGAVILAPWAAMELLGPPLDRSPDAAFPAMRVVTAIVQMVLTYLLTGVVTYGVVQQMRGQTASLGSCVSKGMQNLGRSIGTGLLVGLRVFLFMLLLIVPGIMEFCRLYVAIPAAIMEERGGSHAVSRSMVLTDGSRWPIFGVGLVIMVMSSVLVILGGFVVANLSGAQNTFVAWFTILITVIFQTLSATAMAVCYFLLRRGKENVDPAALAAVFD